MLMLHFGQMGTHQIKFRAVDRDIFEAIKSGRKTVETRAATPKYRQIKRGDVLRFTCGQDQYEKRVKSVRHFAGLDELVKVGWLPRVLPGETTLKAAEKRIFSFTGYREKISEYGLLGFTLEDFVQTRTMRRSDVASIQSLADEYLEPYYGSQLQAVRDWLLGSNSKTAWVAELDGEVVGFVVVSDKPDKDYLKLASLVVRRGLRRRGVGHHLLLQTFEYASGTVNERILLTVAEDNGLSRRYFERHGFVLVGTIANKYRPGKAELVYQRVIAR